MNKISARQLYFFLACIAPVGKLVLLPTQLVLYAQNDLLIPAALNYLLQAGAIFCAVLLARREKTLSELLENTFGKVGRIIFSVFLSLFFLYAAILPILEQKLFVQGVFYDTLPSLIAFAPYFLFSAYLCAKPLSSLGRAFDLLAPLSIVGIAGILILSVSNADFGALAPVGASGASGIFRGMAYTMSWFFDSAIVLLLVGKFDYMKGMAVKSTLFYLIGGAVYLFFLAVFYGVFSSIAARQIFAFTKISKYFSAVSVLGRIDYVFICLIALVMAFYTAIPLQTGTCLLRESCGRKGKPIYYSIAVNLVLLLISLLTNYSFHDVLQTISVVLFWIFPLFTLLLPPLCLLLRSRKREKKIR